MRGALVVALAVAALVAPAYADDGDALQFEGVYKAELWRNTAGGVERGSRYLDNLDVTLALDGERLFGWRGGSAFFYGRYNNGESLSGDLVGDVHGVSNIDTEIDRARLYEAWVEQRFAGGRASVRAGLYDLNSEFDWIEVSSVFLNSSRENGPELTQSVYLSTSLGLRVDYAFDDAWTLRAVVLDGGPGDFDDPDRTLRFSDSDGALVTTELAYAANGVRAAFGYWRHTAEHEALLASAMAGAPVWAEGSDGAYAYVEASPAEGWSAWVRAGFADEEFNPIGRYVGGGLVRTGIGGRDDDQVGVGLAWAEFGEDYRDAAIWSGAPVERGELSLELTYRAVLTDRFAVQPNLQYIVNPGGDPALDDALAIGLRFEAVLWRLAR